MCTFPNRIFQTLCQHATVFCLQWFCMQVRPFEHQFQRDNDQTNSSQYIIFWIRSTRHVRRTLKTPEKETLKFEVILPLMREENTLLNPKSQRSIFSCQFEWKPTTNQQQLRTKEQTSKQHVDEVAACQNTFQFRATL